MMIPVSDLLGPVEDMWSPPCPSLPQSFDITVNKYIKTVP